MISMSYFLKKWYDFIYMRGILLGIISIGIAIVIISIFIHRINLSTRTTNANVVPVIDLAADSGHSTVDDRTTSTQFFVTANSGYLYKSVQDEEGAAYDFIAKDPDVVDSNVQGASTLSAKKITKKLFPKSIAKNLLLVRKSTDPDGSKHLYFSQKINNTPVFGAVLSVHVRNGGEIYAVVGSLVSQDTVDAAVISVADAEEHAVMAARGAVTGNKKLYVVSSSPSIFNDGLINSVDSAVNEPVQEIVVTDNTLHPTYGEKFMVSLKNGEVLYRQPIMDNALNRLVYDCDGGLTNCPVARTENSAVSNKHDADLMYTQLGDVYTFYKSSFQRDSYDNAGASIFAFVNVVDPQVGCPNAAWIAAPYSELLVCPNMVANDVVAHEFTHAVTEYTAKLLITKQTGALNEAIADIFSFGVDNDWTMAEDAATGILRDASDPTHDPVGPHPDRLFSPYYSCATTDSGGIHANMTVITKTFYLMTEGGSFNGCTISGMGKSTAHKIWYRALTTYLTQTANYNYAYLSVLQSCIDLYGETSTQCNATLKAFQATEVDQQPSSTQTGARCLNVAERTPSCVNAATSTPIPTATPIPSSCLLKSHGDADCNGVIDNVDYEIWRKEKFVFCSQANPSVCGLDSDHDGSLMDANFNYPGTSYRTVDTLVDSIDFEIWRKGKFGN